MKNVVHAIAAIGNNRALGKDGELLWHLPEDLKRFKQLTLGHPVIMGRKTWESLPEAFRPLPGRTNIVLTHDTGYTSEGGIVVHSVQEALDVAQQEDSQEAFVIGGGTIYEAFLPYTKRLYLTIIDAKAEADTFFPDYADFRKEIAREEHLENTPPYTFLTLERA